MSGKGISPQKIDSSRRRAPNPLSQITSQMTRKDRYCVEIRKNETIGGTLRIDSYIRTNMTFTANKKQILKGICRVNGKTYTAVVGLINDLIKS